MRAFAGIVFTDFANLLRGCLAMAFTANSLLYPCNTLSAIVNIVLSISLGWEEGGKTLAMCRTLSRQSIVRALLQGLVLSLFTARVSIFKIRQCFHS